MAIQEAYYLHAQNPSEMATLIKIATSIGLDGDLFSQQINSDKVKQQLMNEITRVRAMPIQGFPSLVLAVDSELYPIRVDYKNWQTSYNIMLTILKKVDLEKNK